MTHTPTLEQVEADFEKFGAHEDARRKFMPILQALEVKDKATLDHSIRVAYLGAGIADYTHIAPAKTLWLPGLVHDAGKLLIRPETLTKVVGFNAKDYEEMKNHVEYGCRFLLGIADFSSVSSFYHHFFKTRGAYPALEDFGKIFGSRFDSWTEGERTLAKYCGRLIAIADFYDAATTRKNDKFSPGHPRLPTREESKGMLTSENKDQAYLIEKLYDAGVFGRC